MINDVMELIGVLAIRDENNKLEIEMVKFD